MLALRFDAQGSWRIGGQTSCEEAVFGEDGYGVDEEDENCRVGGQYSRRR